MTSTTKPPRKKYSPQFKDEALERAKKDGVKQAAQDLGIAEAMLYSWRTRRQQGGSSLENQKLKEGELSRLKRENTKLAEENAFLKKVAQYFTTESK